MITEEILDRIRKRLELERGYAENNRIVAELLQPQLDAFERGQCDGGHHKMRVIDDMVRALTGDQYNTWVEAYTEGGEWEWDTGI